MTDLEYRINKLDNKLNSVEANLSQLKIRRQEVLELHDGLIEDRANILAELKLLYEQREKSLREAQPFS
jgi:hypothetical protein